jgi:lipid-A-disaccharide synthase-like uncharacterized protein
MTVSVADMIWNGVAATAQVVFAVRFLWQWIISERRRESVVPPIFWYFSLAGGVLLSAYALFRDPVILVSAAPSVMIYARNIALISRSNARTLSYLGLAVLLASATALLLFGPSGSEWLSLYRDRLWQTRSDILWFAFGCAGQMVFFTRFIWQWIVSERRGESVIPVAFWHFSLAGGSMLTVYALFRDIWIVPGQAAGLIVYVRNLLLIRRADRARHVVADATPSTTTVCHLHSAAGF